MTTSPPRSTASASSAGSPSSPVVAPTSSTSPIRSNLNAKKPSRASIEDEEVETLMHGVQRMQTSASISCPSPPPSTTPSATHTPPETLASRLSASVVEDHSGNVGGQSGVRRHSMPNVVNLPGNGSRLSAHSSNLGFIPENRPVQMGGYGAQQGIPSAIGHSRTSAPIYSSEIPPSAAQWYFGSTPSSSLVGLLPHQQPLSSHHSSTGYQGRNPMPRVNLPNNSMNNNGVSPGMPNGNSRYPPSGSVVGGSYGQNSQSIPGFNFEYQTGGLPAGAVNPSGSLHCFLVQFTSGRTDTYYIPYDSTLTVSVGDYVVVEADRGEDLGRVFMDNITVPLPRRNSTSAVYGAASPFESVSPTYEMDDFATNNISGYGGTGAGPTPPNFPKRIYRLAQPVEIESLLGKVRDEINAIAVGQYKVQEWKLPMAIIDAEYQWDRRKLTFFFSVTLPQFYPNQPPPRIDFRTLVRDLYQIYRTRIWMYCVDKDKNRANRAHNREKFLKQLYKDAVRNHQGSSGQPAIFGNHLGSAGGCFDPSVHQGSVNSSASASPDADEWDMREVFKTLKHSVDVEDLSFGMVGQNNATNESTEPLNDVDTNSTGHVTPESNDGKMNYSSAAKSIWSEKPASVTSKFPAGSEMGSHKQATGSSREFDSMPYFVDYGIAS